MAGRSDIKSNLNKWLLWDLVFILKHGNVFHVVGANVKAFNITTSVSQTFYETIKKYIYDHLK